MVELVKQPVVELVKQESGDRRIGGCAVGEEGRVARLPSCHQAGEDGFVHLVRRPVPAGRLNDLNHHDGSHRKGHQISELAWLSGSSPRPWRSLLPGSCPLTDTAGIHLR